MAFSAATGRVAGPCPSPRDAGCNRFGRIPKLKLKERYFMEEQHPCHCP